MPKPNAPSIIVLSYFDGISVLFPSSAKAVMVFIYDMNKVNTLDGIGYNFNSSAQIVYQLGLPVLNDGLGTNLRNKSYGLNVYVKF